MVKLGLVTIKNQMSSKLFRDIIELLILSQFINIISAYTQTYVVSKEFFKTNNIYTNLKLCCNT